MAKFRNRRHPQSSRSARKTRLGGGIAAGVALATALTGCQSVISVQPAEDAANPLCANMMVLLPAEISGVPKHPTSSQSTAAWGDPSEVILRCGVQVPGPTTDPCVSVNGVDWIAREGENGIWTLTTYGRTPATEVLLDPNVIPSSTVLAMLSDAAAKIPAEGQCVSVDKSVDL